MPFDAGSLYFTADLHLADPKIIAPCQRPFRDLDEMGERLLANWNAVVPPGGTVIVVGDVGANITGIRDFLRRAHGTKHLVAGNHDEHWSFKQFREAGFANCDIRRNVTVTDPDGNYTSKEGAVFQEIICDHYPLRTWKNKPHGAWHVHGHVHGNFHALHKSLDVGVDCHGYAPVSYAEIKARMARQPSGAKTLRTKRNAPARRRGPRGQ